MTESTMQKPERQHSLDALRAFAMLMGIGLHAALSFAGIPWMVQDTKSNPLFVLFFLAVHGFRMPLFILVSGYFTMMLYRQRGLESLLKQRFQRVFLPCMLGLITVLPALNYATEWAVNRSIRQNSERKVASEDRTTPVRCIRAHDTATLEKLLNAGTDVNQLDPEFGVSPLGWATLLGDMDAAKLLIDRGADVNFKNQDGFAPIHQAAFMGRPELVELLLKQGADAGAKGNAGDTVFDVLKADMATTSTIASVVSIPVPEESVLMAGRAEAARLISEKLGTQVVSETETKQVSLLEQLRRQYRSFLTSDKFNIKNPLSGEPLHLMLTPVWHHLWFLWFLCWLVAGFAIVASVAERTNLPRLPAVLMLSPFRLAWILPLTMIPQLFMGLFMPSFGPDTSVGILPQPHVLLYYGIFFAVGAFYYDCNDQEHRLGRWWSLSLSVAFGVVLWVGLGMMSKPLVGGFLQILYTWLMIFGLIGLFRKLVKKENKPIRYLSDSAYWLYLVHLPLVVVLQGWVRTWEYPAVVKFAFICTLTTGSLLITYETMIRYTWVGRLLNGRRTRTPRQEVV